MRKIVVICFAIFLATVSAASADFNFPYSNLNLRLPIYEEPLPGIGAYYGSLSKGMNTVLWNPAGLTKIATAEAHATIPMGAFSSSFNKSFQIEDNEFDAGEGFSNGIYFTDDLSDLTKKERTATSTIGYNNPGSSLELDQAIKFGDWLAVGIKTVNPLDASWDVGGNIPVTSKYTSDLNNFSQGDLRITNGKLAYKIGGVYVETTDPVWDGFLIQDLKLPTTAKTSLRNSVSLQNSMTITGAVKYGQFSAGLNITPISVQSEFDNSVKAIVSAGALDMPFYTPDFDPNIPGDAAAWISDPAKGYETVDGYKKTLISVPEGEVVADAKWSGAYSGACIRQDLGLMWDPQPWLVFSLMAENLGGAVLDMKGKGLSYYANHRFNTENPDIDPMGGIDWSPFTYGSQDFIFPDGQGLYMEESKTYELPRKLRYGMHITRPFLIALDYEMRTNPMIVQVVDSGGSRVDVGISNINVLRLGSEMQLFALPIWLRGGIGVVSKPSADNAEVQAKIDSTFPEGIPFLPAKLDLGLQTEITGAKTGLAFGVDAMSAISLYSVDLLYTNIAKPLFWTLYTGKENWKVSYTAAADIPGTVMVLKSKGIPMDRALESLSASDIKWNQTVAVSLYF
jgi:hypothetical protein